MKRVTYLAALAVIIPCILNAEENVPVKDFPVCKKPVCLNIDEYGDTGWHEINLILSSSKPKVCFIRWENSVFFEKVSGVSKTYYLKPDFDPNLLSYKCTDENQCEHWMLKQGLCAKT
jgi:hypothetical protein